MEIDKILRQAGWEPNRNIEIKNEEIFLKEKGYHILESFKSFYKEFGELYFNVEVDGKPRTINFNLKVPVTYDYDDVIINDYPKLIKCNYLNKVGNINGTSELVIDENGIIYSLYDGLVSIKGKGEEAIENLLTKPWREFESLPIPDWW